MAKTLTSESSLLQRQQTLASDLRLLKQFRIAEWGGAALFIAGGLYHHFMMGAGYFVLFIGGFLFFLALGHEFRRREEISELAETDQMRAAKETVAKLLDDKLANDHFVLNSLRLKVGREKCWVDHLVVAPSGMFVIHTLNWDGTIVGDTAKQAYTWKIRSPDGKIRPVRNPLARSLRERRLLCNWLKGTNLIWERVFPVVVLANPSADIQVTNAAGRVMTPEQAITFINDFCFEKPILSNGEVEKLAQGLNVNPGAV